MKNQKNRDNPEGRNEVSRYSDDWFVKPRITQIKPLGDPEGTDGRVNRTNGRRLCVGQRR